MRRNWESVELLPWPVYTLPQCFSCPYFFGKCQEYIMSPWISQKTKTSKQGWNQPISHFAKGLAQCRIRGVLSQECTALLSRLILVHSSAVDHWLWIKPFLHLVIPGCFHPYFIYCEAPPIHIISIPAGNWFLQLSNASHSLWHLINYKHSLLLDVFKCHEHYPLNSMSCFVV